MAKRVWKTRESDLIDRFSATDERVGEASASADGVWKAESQSLLVGFPLPTNEFVRRLCCLTLSAKNSQLRNKRLHFSETIWPLPLRPLLSISSQNLLLPLESWLPPTTRSASCEPRCNLFVIRLTITVSGLASSMLVITMSGFKLTLVTVVKYSRGKSVWRT